MIVFYAEDDDDDVTFFEIIVRELNLDIDLTRAKDGEELLNLLKTKVPDIIFLDINIPKKNGFKCFVEIRKNPRYNNVKLFLYSGSFFIGSVFEKRFLDFLKDYENVSYVRKSNSIHEMKKEIKNCLILALQKLV